MGQIEAASGMGSMFQFPPFIQSVSLRNCLNWNTPTKCSEVSGAPINKPQIMSRCGLQGAVKCEAARLK
jgi:hypothetical protein